MGKVVLSGGGKIDIGGRVCFLPGPGTTELIAPKGGVISIGSFCIFNYDCIINATQEIYIGQRCQLGYGVIMLDNNMHGVGVEDRLLRPEASPIRVEDNVWIGSRAVILPGATIGQGAVVSAGSVVSGHVPPRVVVAGNPARVVKVIGDATKDDAKAVEPSPAGGGKTDVNLVERVLDVVKSTFAVKGEVSLSSRSDQIHGWDSIGQLNLLLHLEQTFGISIGHKDVPHLTSVAAIVNLLTPVGRDSATVAELNATPAKESKESKQKGKSITLTPVKVAVLANYTANPLLDALRVQLHLSGFDPEFFLGDYDTIVPTVLDDSSDFYKFGAEFIIVTQWLEGLSARLVRRFMSVKDVSDAQLDQIVNHHLVIIESIRTRLKTPVMINNFPLVFGPVLGIYDCQNNDLELGLRQKINQRVTELCTKHDNVFVADYQSVGSMLGAQNFYSEKLWHMGKIPFTPRAFEAIADLYGRLIRALEGKTKKCLVLDCDNTLWGGVIGEDGINGIQLGHTFPGSCFRNFHEEILNLHDRGVILALCSKNNEADVMDVLQNHESCLLKPEHFAIWEINWHDKASNLRHIAKTLNIGLDSFVFVDDSAFECDLVRSQIPEVEVIKAPSTPELLPGLITSSGWFDSLSLTDEDKVKNKMYRAESQRAVLRASATNLDEYLQSLELKDEIQLVEESSVMRVAQLTQKTNQFNLTTIRYSEDDIRAMIQDNSWRLFQLKVSDKVAEFGLVGVAIIKIAGDHACIDSFLMSCRVLGRGIETAFLHYILEVMQNQGIQSIKGAFKPSSKNQQVADFYDKNEFCRVNDAEWTLGLTGRRFPMPAWVRIDSRPLKLGA